MSDLDIYFQEMYLASQASQPRIYMSKLFAASVAYNLELKETSALYREWLQDVAPIYKEQGII